MLIFLCSRHVLKSLIMGGSRGTAKLLRVCSDRVHSLLSKVGSPPCCCAVLQEQDKTSDLICHMM